MIIPRKQCFTCQKLSHDATDRPNIHCKGGKHPSFKYWNKYEYHVPSSKTPQSNKHPPQSEPSPQRP